MKAECRVCGGPFDAYPCHVRSGRAKYCSPACKAAAQSTRIALTCEQCGRAFERPRYWKGGEHALCGAACNGAWRAAKVKEAKPAARVEGDAVFIPLTKGEWAAVDRADYESIPMLRENWTLHDSSGHLKYAYRVGGDERLLMHRVILGAGEGEEVDHVDFDGLNNRRSNLRLASRSEQLRHRRKLRTNWRGPLTSRFKGVSLTPSGKWVAKIGDERLGLYATEEDAATAYDIAARERYGEFAEVNFPGGRPAPDRVGRHAPRRKRADASSPYRGVCFGTLQGKWIASFRDAYIGVYGDEIEAARAYDAHASSLGFGDEHLNFPETKV